jgi:hypothetical protein
LNSFLESLLNEFVPKGCSKTYSVLDSMPIITCSGKRDGKVAPELTDKGYCATKSMYYYGMKLDALGFCNSGRLPHPEQIIFTPASVSDFTLYKDS